MRKYSVRGLVQELDRGLRDRYPRVLVEGEVAQLTLPKSGHAYLQLREPGSHVRAELINAICWRDTWQTLRTRPKQGDRVVVRARLGVYPQRGQLQLNVFDISPAGRGDLARKIAERIERLRAEGLLDPSRKRALPPMPRTIGLVTSPTGAAVQDFLRLTGERNPGARILLSPCITQGVEAPSSVVRAIDLLIEDGRAEVIVITRGGGSAEDLMGFQDEQLARFLVRVPVPVVSAIGHETDTSITDLVADASAPTPSAAAVLVLPDARGLIQRVDELDTRLEHAMARSLGRRRERVVGLSRRLRHPGQRLVDVRRRRDALVQRLSAGVRRHLLRARDRTDRGRDRLHERMGRVVDGRKLRFVRASERLSALSPLAVLARGYAVAVGPTGVITDASTLSPGDEVRVRVDTGAFTATVRSASDEGA